MSEQRTIMVMAGGTGGHVYPAMAVADYLIAQGWQVVWLATANGMENRLIADKDYAKATVDIKGVRGNGLLGWLKLPFRLVRALKQTHIAFKHYQPNVVLGMGGYVAFPGGVMAKLLGKPLIVHEQNSIAGLTNQLLSKLAKHVLVAFPQAFGDEGKLVGNPIRKDLTVLDAPEARYQKRKGKLKLLVVGGSLGAAALNDVLPYAFAAMDEKDRPEVVHQSGEKHIEQLKAHYEHLNVKADAKAFIQDMASVYQWADLVICRAGALTIAELAAVGVASILVPFPYAVDDHQTTNAQYLVDGGAAEVVQQKDLDVEAAKALLVSFTREKCLAMAKKAKALAKPEATQVVAEICMESALVNA